ncbi:low molecular weight phosphatase family protein [Prescottella agglutinans]|uniref:Low molecular weight phosphatase family protein n=1 Tax=Prescottella agglutinans TaxID=1644129 RepID=A0A3S3CZB9_9NOCA|nr:low molecular weight phosphatase family protein [Prescottella agglutinans]RVW09318.1 low molecular weight phosphatase family protein [Prescottella agglutinans]
MQLLFVCTGNICRSPTAERLTTAWTARNGTVDLTASSAGTRAVVGSGLEPNAAQVLSTLGGDPDGFAARQLTPAIAGGADLVLTMTESHRDRVLRIAPRQLKRTFTLLEAAHLASVTGPATVAELAAARGTVPRPANADVPDPIGQSATVFGDVGGVIDRALLELLARLRC